MHFPVYMRVGSFRLHPHWVFETLAYAVALRVYLSLRRRWGDPLSEDARWWVVAAAAAGAAVGSKILFWFEDPQFTLTHWRDLAYLIGGKTIVGGLIGGLAAVEWTKRRLNITPSTGDLFALPLVIGLAIGRIGCFLTGLDDHTFGIHTTLPWGVDFGDGPRHPTQLYEIAFVLILGAFLWHLLIHPHREGDLFKGFMVGYFGWRIAVDFLKPDVRVFLRLSSIQWACMAMLVYYANDILRWLRTFHRGAQPDATVKSLIVGGDE
ncbi:MAG: prolipoprotein diacylglyceryl transferase family protein [Candidatus Acidiferrum sp.]|jgi:phosphatidylglycerol---prolipoprotein diacylglyceryl transferase